MNEQRTFVRPTWFSLLLAVALGLPVVVLGQAKKEGSPEKNLPPNVTPLTGFGAGASWSPNGKRIAFMSKSYGDAFEIDLETKLTRLLTGHFLHKGFLRVQYLPNGDAWSNKHGQYSDQLARGESVLYTADIV
jgi:WD40 repeat protein